jgi:hypothetical protein
MASKKTKPTAPISAHDYIKKMLQEVQERHVDPSMIFSEPAHVSRTTRRLMGLDSTTRIKKSTAKRRK